VRWPRRAVPGEINYPIFDRFTAAHFLIGVSYGLLDLSVWLAIVLAIGWEVVEDVLKALVPIIFPNATRDTLRNAAGDIAAVMTGWAITAHLAGA
jgi:hypothetical protein